MEKLFFDLEMPITKLLTEMEIKGIFLKGEEFNAYSKELGKELEDCEKDIYRLVGHEFNIASPKQLQEVLFEERKLTPRFFGCAYKRFKLELGIFLCDYFRHFILVFNGKNEFGIRSSGNQALVAYYNRKT